MDISLRNKMKVVWLCYFTNTEVQDKIKPRKRSKECCPYIPTSISLLENIDEVELYVISPHEYISGVKEFSMRGVKYYFYNAHMPVCGRHWPTKLKWDYISNFITNKLITRKIVNKIKPDLIHLHGAEMAYYSSTIIQFLKQYPSILTVQGFVSKSTSKRTFITKKRIKVEKEIFDKMQNSFYRTQTMTEDIHKMNPAINLFWNNYPKSFTPPIEKSEKNFDIVFFAKVTKDKGILDLLKSVAIIKKTRPEISLCVIGSGHLDNYKQLSSDLGIERNITWTGFLPSQNEVHKLASQARISVLPTYHDIVSGTILESLFLKIPVVAYDVGSIHEINEKEVLISLVEKQDIAQLAKEIKFLLDHPEICHDRAEKAYEKANELFVHTDEEIGDSLLNAYREVINSFNVDMNK